MAEDNVHSGHRERLIQKFLNSPDLPEHELLEILLFSYLPRRDTNELAHRLLRAFGSFKSLFSASEKELMTVEGVGSRVASGIILTGKLIESIKKSEKSEKDVNWSSLAGMESEVRSYFYGAKEERFVIFLISSAYKELAHLEFDGRSKEHINADIPEILKAIAIHKPRYAVIAHNHPSGSVAPSTFDDFTTKKVHLLCEIHGVTLLEHLIVTDKGRYSYFHEGRLDEIKKNNDLDKLLIRE